MRTSAAGIMTLPVSGTAVRVPGHAGWAGQQRSTTGLGVLGAVLGLALVGYGLLLLGDPAPGMKLLGFSVFVTVGLTVWMLTAHLRVSRTRVVRVEVGERAVVFRGADAIIAPMRLLAVAGALILAGWAWAISTVPADRLSTLTLLVVPAVGVTLTVVGVRSLFRRPGAHRLTLTPEGVDLRIPRTGLRATRGEIGGATLTGDRVTVRATAAAARPASWAARDLASDPVLLAELVTFYATTAAARAEIGPATLERLRAGEF